MRRIELIPASLGSRLTSSRGLRFARDSRNIHESGAEISLEVLWQRILRKVLCVGDIRRLQAMNIS
jgi:hypothetical protein